MAQLTCILDPTAGAMTIEGWEAEQAQTVLGDLLLAPRETNCGRPALTPAATPIEPIGASELRVARIYHGSVVDGPGRRSVVQLQGCAIRCPGCYVPETHDPAGGTGMCVAAVVSAALDPAGEPRDGVTVLGGEPFFQPIGLARLLRELKAASIHTTLYSGYTLEALARRGDASVHEALAFTDLLIDGPFVQGLADQAGEWRGSRNQRVIRDPARRIAEIRQ